MPLRVAIATTLRNAEEVIDSFIAYHLEIGFDHLFLFFDEPADPSMRRARRYPDVSVIPHDDALRRRRKASALFAARFPDEVMGRQILNLEVAIRLAREQGIDWILHIDHDELFYAPHRSVRDHFAALTDRGIPWIKYPNYEAVPERADIVDYFRTTTLFKKNVLFRSGASRTPKQQALIAATPQLAPDFFHFYANGKSAARISEGLRPFGVHDFKLPGGRQAYAALPGEPVILHYTCCGFEHFWNKFKTLERTYASGVETWWGKDITRLVSRFYLDAREVVGRGDRQQALAFYRRRYVIDDAAQTDALIANDLCCRIVEPARLLARDGYREAGHG